MSESLFKKGCKVLQNEGLSNFVIKSFRYIFKRCTEPIFVKTLFLSNSDEIESLATNQTQVESSECVSITYDRRSESTIPELLSRMEKKIVTPCRHILEFENAKIMGHPCFINVGWRYFEPAFVGNSRTFFSSQQHPFQVYRFPKPAADKKINYGFVIGGSRKGFALWSYEQLPKLYWYEKYCTKLNDRPELIISGELSEWQTRSLELLGYYPTDYVHHKGSEVIDIDKLLVPPHSLRVRNGEFQLCPSAIQWIRDRVRSNTPSGSDELPNRLYVSRADATRRQLVNENEVVSLLNQYGFESVEPGRLSFDNQVRLFSNADLIVGPHGAGLANMIYSDSATIIELGTAESGEHFFVLSNECNHAYQFVTCEIVNNKNIKPRHKDMYVEIDALKMKLDFCLGDTV